MLPYRGEFGDAVDFAHLVAAGGAAERERLLGAVLTDPHLAALDGDLRFAEVLRDGARGTFEPGEFMEKGRSAIEAYVRRHGSWLKTVFVRDANVAICLEHKLVSLAGCLASSRLAPTSRLRASARVARQFGQAAYRVPLASASGATVLRSDRGAGAPARFAFRLATPADPPPTSFGTARPEVGRSVFVDDVDVDPQTGTTAPAGARGCRGRVPTQILVKGVGPTRYAGNRFSRRASGGLTLLQGERDWAHSEALARGGVPVYRPLELALLPYCEWHPEMGWRPLVAYARLPLENLRISDLELLEPAGRRRALAAARSKLAACIGVAPRQVTAAEFVRCVVVRIGRIAGLCEGGRTFGGRPFFHGFLHRQNLSLLGELVDLGEGRFVSDARELAEAYAASGYVDPQRAWTPAVRLAGREAVAFERAACLFASLASTAPGLGPTQPWGELRAAFWRAHGDGMDGHSADRAGDLLGA